MKQFGLLFDFKITWYSDKLRIKPALTNPVCCLLPIGIQEL